MTSNTLVSTYTVDLLNGGRALSATTAGLTTGYLYARGPLAEYSNGGWSYYLTDRANLVRQVTDGDGEGLFAVRYSPWGEVLWQSGADSLVWGYLGGWSDAATGLVYVGNGQYYDPATGRFLTRQGRSGSANPYLPDLTSAILGPLSLAALFVQSRKDRRGKAGRWVVFILLTLTVVAFGAACSAGSEGNGTPTMCPLATQTPTLPPTTTPTVTPTHTQAPTFTPTPTEITLEDLGSDWKITHYHYAMESDDAAFPRDYVLVGGLGNRKFRREFIYNVNKGIPLQGTGLAEDGITYVTIDWIRTGNEVYPNNGNWWNTTDPTTWFFTYGKGGRFREGVAWSSVAISDQELSRPNGLRNGDKVKIDGYSQIFTVDDTGSFEDIKHIDVFIGATSRAEALELGTKQNIKVWRISE